MVSEARYARDLGLFPESRLPHHVATDVSIIHADKLRRLDLQGFAKSGAIQFWGGNGIDKIVVSSACSDNDVAGCHCLPLSCEQERPERRRLEYLCHGPRVLLQLFPKLDQGLIAALFLIAECIKTRRLYNNHEPYPCWVKGEVLSSWRCCSSHDASLYGYGRCGSSWHPILSKYASLDVAEKLRLYEF